MMREIRWCLVFVAVLCPGAATRAELPFEREPINYLTAPVDNRVSRLQTKLDEGEATLAYDDDRGYLAGLLGELNISPSSQVLVFSKTSFQRSKISRRTPRAVYFNDDTYIGFCQQGEVIELSTADPRQGAVFYTLRQERDEQPTLQRQTHDCLQCHASSKTQDVPGHLVRSVFPDALGMPVFNAGTFNTSHESPLAERWGGWFVTGLHGQQAHMGNVTVTNRERPELLDTVAGANVTDLAALVDTAPYLTPHSDIVALLVLEHQVKMHNLITATGYHARMALYYEASINKALGRPSDSLSESTQSRFKSPAEKLLRYLLFVEEAPLQGRIVGTSEFAKQFAARGPRDRQGRSLRDFDLERRLFKYPCSYEIYSAAFDALPYVVKEYIYRRLGEILSGKEQGGEFARLTAADRQAIREILIDTNTDLPADLFR
ncbi:MAG TPA: hypothetical protein VHC22_11635 [Pirellulales bacterium]|nr:hypothetical protein [Pirellulales bacterium]